MGHEMALDLPNPWTAVGRDTEAGRALFALYNGFSHARSRGNNYSHMNRMKHLRYIATRGVPEFQVPKPIIPDKQKVKVPHFLHKDYYSDDYHPVNFIPRRRRAAEILQQIRDDSYIAEMPPIPKGPLLDEAEKARLQEVFYWSNRDLGPEPILPEPIRRLPKKGSVGEQELLLNEIAKEIENREAFLSEIENYCRSKQYHSQVINEIQQRVGQMKLLHNNITKQEKENEKSEKATHQVSTKSPSKSHVRGQPRNANKSLFNHNTGSSPHVDKEERFERSSDSAFTRCRADGTPEHRSSNHEASTASRMDPRTTTH